MKILFLADNFPPETNAAATRVHERAIYWVKWGHDVTVVTCAPNFPQGKLFDGYTNRWYQTEELDGIKIVRVKTYIAPNQGVLRRSFDFFSFMVTGFFAGLRGPAPDVVVATSPQFLAAVAGWAVGAVRRRPFVFELGDLWPVSIRAVGAMKSGTLLNLLENVELFLYRRARIVVALTEAFKSNLVSRGIAADKISVVINGVDLFRYGPRDADKKKAADWNLTGKFVVGYVGTHGMAHALGNVLNAAAQLKDDDDLRILLVGAGAERDALVADAKARDLTNVIFQPAQPKDAMPSIWSLCDVALVHLKDMPAFSEVIPSKIFEAMAMGLPILIAAPTGEASKIIEASQVGICVPAEDPAALADAIRHIMANETERAAMARTALATAPNYSRERQAADMMVALDKAIHGTSAIENDPNT